MGQPAYPHNLSYGHPTDHENVTKLKWEIIWTGGYPTYLGSPNSMLQVTDPTDTRAYKFTWRLYTEKS